MSCAAVLTGPAQDQTPSWQIGVNPEYAFPKDGTPAGAAVDSAALVENANLWDKRIVTFTGEAIGEAMIRGQMAWIHLR
jgi:hypothetical protein